MKLACALAVSLCADTTLAKKTKRKRHGKKYFSDSSNSTPETGIEERLLTDCSLFAQNSQSANSDNTAGRITLPGDYADKIPDKCGWAVDAPKNCDIRFRINTLKTEQFTNANCAEDYFYIKWPGGRGRDKGVANTGRICDQLNFNTQNDGEELCNRLYPTNNNCDMVHSMVLGEWKSTNKDNIYIKFQTDGDPADSMYSNAFDLEWECEGSPDLDNNVAQCEVTDSVFGTVGWRIKAKKQYKAKSGPGQEIFPASSKLFENYTEDDNSRDACGAQCANTAGCYFWNWKMSTEECSITLGTKPGFKGIKQSTNGNYLGQALSGSCGGDIKFGTGYQKSSKFYCLFQTAEENESFAQDLAADNEEINICPYDGIMTTTKILGITSDEPRNAGDTDARWRWTKFTLATHIRLTPNVPQFSTFCEAAPSVWDGDVSYFVKEKVANAKCGKPLEAAGYATHTVSDLKKVQNTDANLFLADNASNCPSNCANTPGCSAYHWDGNNCHLAVGSGVAGSKPSEEGSIEFVGRSSSGCQANIPYQQSYTYSRSFSCVFTTGSSAVDFVEELLAASGNDASDANKGWQFCKTRSGIRLGRALTVSGLDTDESAGGRYRYLGFSVQQYIRMPKTFDTSYNQCDDSSDVNSYFGLVPMTKFVKTSNVCAPGFAWRYNSHPDESYGASYWLRDLIPYARNTADDCPAHCANTAGCFSYTFYRNGGCSLVIHDDRTGGRDEEFRKRDKRVIQSGHIKRSCRGQTLPFSTEFSRRTSFFCRFVTDQKAEELILAIAEANGLTSATKFGKWNVVPPRRGVSKTQLVDMYTIGDTDLLQYLPPPQEDIARNNRNWVGVEFYFTTHVRRHTTNTDLLESLDDSNVQEDLLNLNLPEGTEVEATSDLYSTVEQADSDGSGAVAGTNCGERDGSFVCDCNDGFSFSETEVACVADSPVDEEPEDELASVLSDSSSIDELQSLNLPEDTELEETSEVEAALGTNTEGESSGACDVNSDGSVGVCTCNEGFTANEEGVCISDTPEEVDVDGAITAGLDDSDFINQVQNTDFGATVLETTPIETELSILTADGEEGGSCTTLTDCTCNAGFAEDESGNCVNVLALPTEAPTPEPVVCEYDEVNIDQIIDDVMAKLEQDVAAAGGEFDQASSHVAAFKRIHERVGVMMNKDGRWAECTKSEENAISTAITEQGCGLGVTDIQSMCDTFQIMYSYIFEDCEFDKARTTEQNVRVRCENISNNLRQQDIGLDWL